MLLSLPQCSHSKNLAVPIFAREHGCTDAEVEVLEAREDKPVTKLRTTITDQDGTVVVDGTAVVYTVAL